MLTPFKIYTDKNGKPLDYTRYAYEIDLMKKKRITFEEAHEIVKNKIDEIRTRKIIRETESI